MVFDTIKIARDYQADVRREWAEIRGKRQAKADDERRKFEKSWYERLRATALYAINYVNGEFGEPNSADYKDLLLSAVQGESDRVKKWIFKFGKVDGAVDCRSPLDRKTALMLAAQNKDDASVSHLVNANASTTIADCFGRTALHYACAAGDPECAEILLIGGAQVDAQDDQGRTPLMDAASGQATSVWMCSASMAPALTCVTAPVGGRPFILQPLPVGSALTAYCTEDMCDSG